MKYRGPIQSKMPGRKKPFFLFEARASARHVVYGGAAGFEKVADAMDPARCMACGCRREGFSHAMNLQGLPGMALHRFVDLNRLRKLEEPTIRDLSTSENFACWTVTTPRGAKANTGMGELTESAKGTWHDLLSTVGSMFGPKG